MATGFLEEDVSMEQLPAELDTPVPLTGGFGVPYQECCHLYSLQKHNSIENQNTKANSKCNRCIEIAIDI
ncbi:MAG: hypothetical protein HC862_28155 [Scytonema sp. RU_4_4]|nr:hypothetical protein [Scytonema sp. RU_4_4]NJR73718.1 hypothetical protein [Scytonema sp. CRU_2_7]